MIAKQIRKKFLDFFKSKEHQIVASSSLIPDDSSVLLTTAGMQQFKPYFLGEQSPYGQRVASSQKCFRTSDLDSVGDTSHLTFFEMLGNFSFGDYFKKEAIEWAWEFVTEVLKIDKQRIYVSVFEGDDEVPLDQESINIWRSLGLDEDKIKKSNRDDNFWGPTGNEGPCGPTTEIYVDDIEIWNLVFNEYYQSADKKLKPLSSKGVDTGMGLERLVTVMQNKSSVFETDLFELIIKEILNQKNGEPLQNPYQNRQVRIIADHLRGVCFLIVDGVRPSNIEQGYILRQIIRRIIRQGRLLNLTENFIVPLAESVAKTYQDVYPEINDHLAEIGQVSEQEIEKFSKSLDRGLKEFDKIALANKESISGQEAFELFSTYGFPLELTKDLALEKKLRVDEAGFEEELAKHKDLSRAGIAKKFGGHGLGEIRSFGLADDEKIKKLHTATHLLHQALRQVLGDQVKQMGSDINPERLRFDFSYGEKMTPEQIQAVEKIVNEKIKEDLPVQLQEMSKNEAIKKGALAFFKDKYTDQVKVYSVGNFSCEICAGPHADRTGSLGYFKIKKEQSSSAGVRRIKAILEKY